MIEYRKTQRIQAAVAASQLKAGDEEDSNQILESHLNRVMESPRGQNTPPLCVGGRRRQPQPFQAAVTEPYYGGELRYPGRTDLPLPTSTYDVVNSPRQQRAAEFLKEQQRKEAALRRRKDDATAYDPSSINIGPVPSILSNKVPDVPTPVSLLRIQEIKYLNNFAFALLTNRFCRHTKTFSDMDFLCLFEFINVNFYYPPAKRSIVIITILKI